MMKTRTKIFIVVAVIVVAALGVIGWKFGVEWLIGGAFGSVATLVGAKKIRKNATSEHKTKTDERNVRTDARREESEKAVEDAADRSPPPSESVKDEEDREKRLDDLGPTW